MAVNQTFLHLVVQAGPVVRIVMLLLLAASVLSWTFIFQKGFYLGSVRQNSVAFTDLFWSGTDLASLYKHPRITASSSGLVSIFQAGYTEWLKWQDKSRAPSNIILDNVQRAMTVAETRELEKLEYHLAFLATVGSTAPYVGLFGTVWGIMTSFQALGQAQQATIAMVAPGISEALIATAIGLFAAIPAVIAYNRYQHRVVELETQFRSFQDEFINILQRELTQ